MDLRVDAGEFSVIIGPNGHGKTTILRTASGLVTATAGRITLAGQDITRLSPERIAARGLVHIPQGDLLFPDMTVLENLTLGAFLRKGGRSERAQQLDRVYAIFPRLEERSAQRARTLSGGERRMLALGRGLMRRRQDAHDRRTKSRAGPVLVDEVYRQIAEIHRSGMTILLVEENFSRVRDLADRLTLHRERCRRAERHRGRGAVRSRAWPRLTSGWSREPRSPDPRQHHRSGLNPGADHHRHEPGLRHPARAEHGAGRDGHGRPAWPHTYSSRSGACRLGVAVVRRIRDLRARRFHVLRRGAATARPRGRRLRDDGLHLDVRDRHHHPERRARDLRAAAEAVPRTHHGKAGSRLRRIDHIPLTVDGTSLPSGAARPRDVPDPVAATAWRSPPSPRTSTPHG